jgi:hypothetical protein
VKELAGQWGFSERAIRRLIEEEPGVIAIGKSPRLKRTYRRIRIPAPAAERIYRKLTRRKRRLRLRSWRMPRKTGNGVLTSVTAERRCRGRITAVRLEVE